jgi:hypothetical protein
MLAYDYEIIYKKGKENVVIDALSGKEDDMALLSICYNLTGWKKHTRNGNKILLSNH